MGKMVSVASPPGAARLWPALPDTTRHRLACLIAQILRQQLCPEPLGEQSDAERSRR